MFLKSKLALALYGMTLYMFAQYSAPPSNASANGGKPSGWVGGETVQVYINTNDFPGTRYDAVVAGVNNAANAYGADTPVTYQFIPVTGPPAASGNWIYMSVDPNLPSNQAGANNYLAMDYGNPSLDLVYSNVTLNETLDENGITYWTTHETSHDYQLGDCWTCSPNDTIMSEGSVPANGPFPLSGPSSYDTYNSWWYGVMGGE